MGFCVLRSRNGKTATERRLVTPLGGGRRSGRDSDAPAMWPRRAFTPAATCPSGALAQHAASMAHQELAHNPGAAGVPQQDQRASGGSEWGEGTHVYVWKHDSGHVYKLEATQLC